MAADSETVSNGVRGVWANGSPLAVLSGFEGVTDVEEYQQAVIEMINAVMEEAESNPDVVAAADAAFFGGKDT